ncbi:MAG: heavy metal-associated domain-containing protein [Flavobacterium sp.]|uniref:heavy-metal-associated domain-containing protein n=1 Tax=Flavobacterium sp. TaxID=239 RepID=UPI0032668A2D
MKNIKVILAFFLLIGIAFVSCKKQGEVETKTTKKEIAKIETTSFKIEGMTCAMGCAKTIENKLASLDGVQKASVDFDKKMATIQYDGNIQTAEKLTETVEAVADGKTYKVSGVK